MDFFYLVPGVKLKKGSLFNGQFELLFCVIILAHVSFVLEINVMTSAAPKTKQLGP